MLKLLMPGDLVTKGLIGAHSAMALHGVVIPTDIYEYNRPDVLLFPRITHLESATTPTDSGLLDLAADDAKQPTRLRAYVGTPL